MNFKDALRKLHNRYFYVTLAFVVIIVFIDQFNIFEQIRLHKTLKSQEKEILYFERDIEESKKLLNDLQYDSAVMERKAREDYMMKRDNEVIYIIESCSEK